MYVCMDEFTHHGLHVHKSTASRRLEVGAGGETHVGSWHHHAVVLIRWVLLEVMRNCHGWLRVLRMRMRMLGLLMMMRRVRVHQPMMASHRVLVD
jgi:hypothetical protein